MSGRTIKLLFFLLVSLWGVSIPAAAQSRAEQEEELEFENEKKKQPPEKKAPVGRPRKVVPQSNPYVIEARGAGDFIVTENKDLGHASIQLTSSSLTYRIKLARRGVTVVEFPADDAVYAIHPGNSNYVILDGVGETPTPRRPADPLVFRPGEGYGQKGVQTTTMYAVQFVSGLVVSLIFDPVDNLKDNTNRVILNYNVRDVVVNRRQLGLETNLVHKKKSPLLTANEAPVPRQKTDNGGAPGQPVSPAVPPGAATPRPSEPRGFGPSPATPISGPPPTAKNNTAGGGGDPARGINPVVPEPARSKLSQILNAVRAKKNDYTWIKGIDRRAANNGFILFVAAKKPENNHILYGFVVRKVDRKNIPAERREVVAERVAEVNGTQQVLSVHKPEYILWDENEKQEDELVFAAVQMPINEIKAGEWFRFKIVER